MNHTCSFRCIIFALKSWICKVICNYPGELNTLVYKVQSTSACVWVLQSFHVVTFHQYWAECSSDRSFSTDNIITLQWHLYQNEAAYRFRLRSVSGKSSVKFLPSSLTASELPLAASTRRLYWPKTSALWHDCSYSSGHAAGSKQKRATRGNIQESKYEKWWQLSLPLLFVHSEISSCRVFFWWKKKKILLRANSYDLPGMHNNDVLSAEADKMICFSWLLTHRVGSIPSSLCTPGEKKSKEGGFNVP